MKYPYSIFVSISKAWDQNYKFESRLVSEDEAGAAHYKLIYVAPQPILDRLSEVCRGEWKFDTNKRTYYFMDERDFMAATLLLS